MYDSSQHWLSNQEILSLAIWQFYRHQPLILEDLACRHGKSQPPFLDTYVIGTLFFGYHHLSFLVCNNSNYSVLLLCIDQRYAYFEVLHTYASISSHDWSRITTLGLHRRCSKIDAKSRNRVKDGGPNGFIIIRHGKHIVPIMSKNVVLGRCPDYQPNIKFATPLHPDQLGHGCHENQNPQHHSR